MAFFFLGAFEKQCAGFHSYRQSTFFLVSFLLGFKRSDSHGIFYRSIKVKFIDDNEVIVQLITFT